jgi:rhodanese-related sulfurtransferase
LFEVFADAPENVGAGVKPFRDPSLSWDFEAPGIELDVREPHVYAAEWSPDGVRFAVDGETVRTVRQAPAYPLQMMVAVFDFPEKPGPPDHVPMLAVDFVRGG